MDAAPNVILVLVDDQGFGQLPVYSEAYPDEMLFLTKNTERYRCDEQKAKAAARACMPNLNKLAQNGVTFMNAHVTSPVCGPSRAALMTGRYQQRFGVYDNCDLAKAGVPLSETMLPELFQKAGYRTAMIGKWHLGKTTKTPLPVQTHDYHKNAIAGCIPEHNPINRGFDHYFGFNSSGTTYYDSPSLFRGLENVTAQGYSTEEFTDDAVRFIEDSGEDPFFIFLAYNAPHIPLEDPAPQKYQRFDTGNPEVDNYYATLAAVDDGLGKIFQTLEKRGELDNTLIFYLSDNGAVIDSPQPMNGPFRGNKGNFHHGGMHVPMIAHWPARLKPSKHEARVASIDVMPTALAAAGIELPDNLDGVPMFGTTEDSHEAIFWAGPEIMHWSEDNKTFWRDYWEYVTERTDDAPSSPLKAGDASWAVQKGPWLLRCNEVTGKTELFDTSVDPGERSDVVAQHPETAAALRDEYKAWAANLGKPLVWSEEQYNRLVQ
ncbi:sulfatase family protein [Tichowtungia aerotolerans]|uniref:Sulfatase-like hydrolase/transferase n=1 Tax=Tichowtungia aerotolerans TaxID=2697043 RepID=A0A6P1M3E5_9BACT|nr:sulfatase-like hydrolase/transferase [Tichowtungia aerotolerans]QHI69130.1 sulfatase-like hydrolase/transferase [Tichowtungia aerotolerans]